MIRWLPAWKRYALARWDVCPEKLPEAWKMWRRMFRAGFRAGLRAGRGPLTLKDMAHHERVRETCMGNDIAGLGP